MDWLCYQWNIFESYKINIYSVGEGKNYSEKPNEIICVHWLQKKIKFSPYIRTGAVAKAYMKKGFLIYEEMHNI